MGTVYSVETPHPWCVGVRQQKNSSHYSYYTWFKTNELFISKISHWYFPTTVEHK
jgi:hypothetical protein